ncbi:sulfotransferase [Aestuariibaculum marinum]|uniref:Sulfotransferase n=1 Tax=Aestuariibaculum marinum TaxID=2683592 RepID=A0A8J6U4B6_9FLAO|nr:sulfotransferase [Aestuariibaculum marinum]MBD0823872.1 sulfotransferase [Aestuariibaculum marinum]
MIDNKRIYIHLGLHKTATTFFQRSFYPAHPEFNYKQLRSKEMLADFNQYILRENDLTYNLITAKSLFCKALVEEEFSDKLLTLCEEQFSGLPLQDAFNRKTIFDRLNAFFPNANYILVLRNPNDFVKSMYAEYLKKGGTADLYNFLNRKDSQLSFSRGSYLRYNSYYSYIESHVTKDRIKVLYYEDLKCQPSFFYRDLLDYFKLNIEIKKSIVKDKRNISFDKEKLEALRFYNRIAKTPYGKDHLISKKYKKYIIGAHLAIFGRKRQKDKLIEDFVKSLKIDNSNLPDYNRIKKYNY